ncbi:SCP2 domain-containing protein [Herminiimonas sp. NPDC097707]|uniref:ubiquinone anaerobic biosynthesis accessory factor UbiT n=1 Tax=Herminiimonas sp. NPDC097707 TaxID=3364007 RepID=UPI00383AF916
MNQIRPVVPAALAKMLSLLPVYPGSLLFVRALNLLLARHLPSDTQAMLEGRTLRISVLDLQLSFDFQWRAGRFSARRLADNISDEIDLTIGATAHDFLLLAQRKEDPDTLFFSRRLQMEGDTELGLLVKNTLDAIEAPVFDPARLAPMRVLARFKSGLVRESGVRT